MQALSDYPCFPTFQSTAPRMLTVAVTGHRNLGFPETTAFVAYACRNILSRLQKQHSDNIMALSAIATGADTLFADAAIDLNIPLSVVLAADDIIEDYPSRDDREHFLHLSQQGQVHRLPFPKRCDRAYVALGNYLANVCDILVAVWNGQPAMGPGGTGDVVAYAKARARPIIHIDTRTSTISYSSTLASLSW